MFETTRMSFSYFFLILKKRTYIGFKPMSAILKSLFSHGALLLAKSNLKILANLSWHWDDMLVFIWSQTFFCPLFCWLIFNVCVCMWMSVCLNWGEKGQAKTIYGTNDEHLAPEAICFRLQCNFTLNDDNIEMKMISTENIKVNLKKGKRKWNTAFSGGKKWANARIV